LLVLLVLAGVAWLASREFYYRRWMDDDAFISFRYARNLVHGDGLTFNPGERVEGYTNFLWTLLLAGCGRLGFDIPVSAQILGALFSFATLALFMRFGSSWDSAGGRDPWRSDPIAIVPALLLCASASWAVWAVSGLENTFEAFLVTLGFLAYFRAMADESGNRRPRRRNLLAASVALSLATLTHPSNVVFLGVAGVHRVMVAIRDPARRPALAKTSSDWSGAISGSTSAVAGLLNGSGSAV